MAWVVLIASGVLEAVWATALGRAEGFTRLAPLIVFLVALALSMVGLSYAVKTLPAGTACAVWVGSAPPSRSPTACSREPSRSRWRRCCSSSAS
mgnify:FL=1